MYPTFDLYNHVAARAIEARAIADLGGDDVLMRRAGHDAWQYLLTHWPQVQRIDVVCGPGNNGGDGYVLAQHAQQSGRRVRVVHVAGHTPRTAEAQRAADEYRAAGGQMEVVDVLAGDAELVVDALFGIGLTRALEGPVATLVASINACGAPVLALDTPSGVDADRGHVQGVAVRATHTLQFIVAHQGLYTGDALEYVGQRALAALDINTQLATASPSAERWVAARLRDALPPRRRNTHKGESGHVLAIGGNHGSGGALLLCVQAALRAGAGLVSGATRSAHVPALLVRCPEAMAHAVEAQEQLRPMIERASVLALGPGLGTDAWAREMFAAALAAGKPAVIDADALNLLAERPDARLPAATVLTPHPGEAGRLLGITTADVQADRYGAAAALVARFGVAIILKGAGTVVAAPGQRPRVIAAGNPGMAVGGMGDLLTGVTAALLAQGLNAFDAASHAALLHGLAGDAAAAEGERGLLPSDLLPHLRRLANP